MSSGVSPLSRVQVTGSDQKDPFTWRHLIPRREKYWGSLTWNFVAFLLPALYSTLSKLWVAQIDSSQVVTTDVYTYISTIAEVLNDGLPRTAWLIIGDNATRTLSSRIGLSRTLVLFQTIMGLLMTTVFVAAAKSFASAFVPPEVRESSLKYVRLSAPVALTSAVQVAVSSCTRALDLPDVPLLISSTGFIVNIVLDLLLISRFHIGSFQPTILTQAGIRLACDTTAAIAGVLYFLCITGKMHRQSGSSESQIKPIMTALCILLRPAVYTFSKSVIRNVIYLWVVARIISLGQDYATAWGVFNTIRWGLVMVTVQALEASALTFVGHRWGQWRAEVGASRRRPVATWKDIKVRSMWRNMDWCYIFYALNYQLAAILLATVPRWYFYQALGSNFLWMLPWAIVVTVVQLPQDRAWTFYSIIFGGALVFDFFNVTLVLGLWARQLMKGKLRLQPTAERS